LALVQPPTPTSVFGERNLTLKVEHE